MSGRFSAFHPAVSMSFFVCAVSFSMFLTHPILLAISFFAALAYRIYVGGAKGLKALAAVLPFMLLALAVNVLFNHQGVTILFYFRDNPITLESIAWAIGSCFMLGSVMMWFSCYNAVMSSDKFIYLFGKAIPKLSLIFSMTLRFVPLFTAKLREISAARKGLLSAKEEKGTLPKIKNALAELSILITWALENAADTAASMKSRGYSLPGRTAFSRYRFRMPDCIMLAAILIFAGISLAGVLAGKTSFTYFPAMTEVSFSAGSLISYAAYAGLMLLPLAADITEDIKWYRLKSKI